MMYQIGQILYNATNPVTNISYQLSDSDLFFLFDFFEDFFPLSAGLFLASMAAFHRANWTWCSRSISLSVTVSRMHCTQTFHQTNQAKLTVSKLVT